MEIMICTYLYMLNLDVTLKIDSFNVSNFFVLEHELTSPKYLS